MVNVRDLSDELDPKENGADNTSENPEQNEPVNEESTQNEAPENQEKESTEEAAAPVPPAPVAEEVTEEESKPEEPAAEEAAPVDANEPAVAAKTEEEPPEATPPTSEPAKEDSKEEAPAAAEKEESPAKAGDSGDDGDSSEGDDEENEQEDIEEKDYHSLSKEELVTEIEALLDHNNYRQIDKILKEIRPAYDEIHDAERKAAMEKFIAEGGEETAFDYKPDDLDNRFEATYTLLQDRKSQYFREQEKNKETNLQKKQDVLEKLRELVDGDETNASINKLKELQQEWKSVGPIPSNQVKTLWANYNALLDRFYDQRSIYFELKELDRKKNLESKNELVARAEKLSEMESIKDAIKELNELHEEFKHIGPVPKDDQEELWQRFKSASDKVYEKRNSFYEGLRKELDENLKVKQDLITKLEEFTTFDSDRISEWNQKTKDILAIQKEWEQAGRLPREKAKEVNKAFWSSFKSFFNNKGNFFKKLEGQREENLEKKRKLVEQADALKDNSDWNQTAEKLKKLQREWKEIGPVPEKQRNEVYAQFKAACDHFFNQRRQANQDKEKEFHVNLEKKLAILDEIEKLAEAEDVDKEQVESMLEEYAGLGFVPRNAIKSTQKRYDAVLKTFLKKNDSIDEDELKELEMRANISKIKSGPNAGNKLFRKEQAIRKQIQSIESDISTWKNNLEFFASSKTADKMKAEFQEKIDKATQERDQLKEQLRMVRRASND